MRPILLLTLLLLSFCKSDAQTIMGRQYVDQFSKSSTGVLTYGLTWVPVSYANTTRTYPLIIALHGTGEVGTTQADLARLYTASPRSVSGRIADGWNAVAMNPLTGVMDSFIVVSPQAPSWSYGYSELRHILPSILSKYRVDTSRIYLTGLSAGGGGVFTTFGSRDSNFIKKFAAMATANGAGTGGANGYTYEQVEAGLRFGSNYGVRLWTIASELDQFVSSNIRYHDSANFFNPIPANKFTVIAGVGHSAWGRAYDPSFRPVINYYGKTGTCNNGCPFGGVPLAPNNNGSAVTGSGVTQDSLNLYEWFLLSKRTFAAVTTPTANAGADQVISLPSTSVTVNGSGSAGQGNSITSISWSKLSGPLSFTIANPSSLTTAISNLAPGVYIFRLSITNNLNVTATDDVSITVSSPTYGSPLLSAISGNQTITLPVNNVNLTSSYTLNGAALQSIVWSKLKVPGQVKRKIGIIGSSTSQGGGSSSNDSSYVGLLRKYFVDNGLVDSVINFGTSGYSVFRAMPSSYSPVGVQESPDVSKNITAILNRNVDVVIVNFPTNGFDILTLSEVMMAFQTIYDSCLAKGVECFITTTQPREDFTPLRQQFLKDLKNELISRFGNHAINFYDPVTIPGTTTTMPAYASGDNIHLNNAGHRQLFNKVVAADILKKFTTSPSTFGSATSQNTTITNLTQGEHRFQVTVTDGHQQSISRVTTITVNAGVVGNQAPIASAGPDQTLSLPIGLVTLDGSATDADGTISSYQWTKISGPLTGILTSPLLPLTTVTGLLQGVFQFELRVTDNNGAVGRDTVQITINSLVSQPPVANAGTDQTLTLPLNSVTLTGTGTASIGAVTYSWTKLSGPASGSIVSAGQATTVVNNLTQGVYSFGLTITDIGGLTARDTVQVSVLAAQTSVCSGRRFTPAPAADSGYFNYADLKPGDTLFIDGSRAWSYIYLEGKNGTPQCPIVIMNVNGQAKLRGNSAQIKLRSCSYIKVLGNGTPGVEYGFYIQPYPTDILVNGAYAVSIEGRSKNVEVRNVHITHAGIGMNIKEDGGCDPAFNNPNWILDSISIHHNKISKTWNQGLYIGNTSPDNAVDSYSPRAVVCNGVTTYPRPARMGNIKVYENIIDSTGRAGIQLSSASTGLSEIYNNTVSHSGMNGDEAQGAGINLGAYSNVWVYNNTIRNTFTYGISSFGASSTNNVLRIENNTIDSSGYMRHYYLWQPGLSRVDLKTRAVNANTIPWVYSIGVYSKPTDNPVDSTRFRISGNSLGYRKNTGGGIVLSDNQNTFHKSGNYVCNNIATAGGSTNVVVEQPTIPVFYSTNCTAPVNINPVANAGTNQSITLPINSVTLTGSGTDADGSISSYQWTKLSGPASGSITTATQSQTTVTLLSQGVYQFELRVTDNNGAVGRDTVQVTVNAAGNQPPVANAGTNQSITLPINSVTLTGSGTDADGSISSYQWTKLNGPASGTITTATQSQTTVTLLSQGVYQFELRVTDNNGAVGRDTVQVTVNVAGNQPPVANAGTNQSITLPINSVTLTGSGTDADGSISSYQWTKLSGPVSGSITTATQSQTTVTLLSQGVYQFELLVTDNNGAVGRDTVQVTVNVAGNQPPVANAGTNQSITLPINSVTLTGSGTDADGSISSYQWTKLNGPASGTITTATQSQTTVTLLSQGVYQFELRVTDNNGAVGRDTVQVTVNVAGNQPPVANAGTNQNITLPTNTVTLNGSGTDADGSISSYQWTKLSGPASGTITTATQSQTTVTLLSQGVYQFELLVTDNNGAVGRDTVQVTVNAAVNQPPVANAGPNQVLTIPINSFTVITLNGGGTDADGSISSYQWTKLSGPVNGTILNPTQAQTTVVTVMQGVYQFELRVTDNNGAVGRDTVQVTVNAAGNQPPIANAGPNQVLTIPINSFTVITLNGSGTDADGSISSYQWTKLSGPVNGTILNPTQAQTTVVTVMQGVYQFELLVMDNNGAVGRDTVQVTVNAAVNQPPVANAGINQTITLPTNTVTLNGSGTDADGSITSYQWTKLSGPAEGAIISPAQGQTLVTDLSEGLYMFVLTVRDNNGATASDTVEVLVKAADVVASLNVRVYPNPAVNSATLVIESPSKSGKAIIRLYTETGALVNQREVLMDNYQLTIPMDLSTLQKGMYVIYVNIDVQNTRTIKLIKQ
jgi:lysophospholipase L1-like esterase